MKQFDILDVDHDRTLTIEDIRAAVENSGHDLDFEGKSRNDDNEPMTALGRRLSRVEPVTAQERRSSRIEEGCRQNQEPDPETGLCMEANETKKFDLKTPPPPNRMNQIGV